MSATGSIESISVRGRLFSVAADSAVTRKLGGFEGEHLPNGDGTGRKKMTRVGWMVGAINVSVYDSRGDQSFLQDISDTPDYDAFTITYVDGTVWQGLGSMEGEISHVSDNGTVEVSLSGPGKLTQQ